VVQTLAEFVNSARPMSGDERMVWLVRANCPADFEHRERSNWLMQTRGSIAG
jgi:hypothetical protein